MDCDGEEICAEELEVELHHAEEGEGELLENQSSEISASSSAHSCKHGRE